MGDTVVCLKNIEFHYKNGPHILNKVSLKTHTSEICTIVGPSGCGKTTLIKIIISQMKPLKGSVSICGKNNHDPSLGIPGPNLGYMPQELSVPSDLLVKEALFFYASLYKMKGNISKRINQVLKELQLHDYAWKFVFTLSGGMKRRLSLAIAILHDPYLLILDEPTVGADPMLRNRIWELLKEMRRQEQSIIITTHYIEECKHADNILFMREGAKVGEGSPTEIISQFNVSNLDNAFIHLCHKQSTIPVNEIVDQLEDEDKENDCETYLKAEPVRKSIQSNLFIIFMLSYRYFHLFLFNPLSLLVLIVTPTMNVLLFHYTKQDLPSEVPIGIQIDHQLLNIIDEDLLKDHNLTLDRLECIHPQYFYQHVNKSVINLINYTNFDDAIQDAKKTKIKGLVAFNQNFTYGFLTKLVLIPTELDMEDVRNSKIFFTVDAVNKAISDSVEAFLLIAYRDYWIEAEKCLGLAPLPLNIIKFEDSVVGHIKFDDHGNSHSTVFALVFIVPFTCSLFISGMALLNEIQDESMQRYLSTGLSPMKIYVAHFISNSVLLGFTALLSLYTTKAITNFHTDGSWLLACALVLCQVSAGIFLGQAVALIFKSEVFVILFVLAISYTAFGTQGFYVPIESQPVYMRYFTKSLPMARPLVSLKAILFGEHTFTHHLVYEGFIVTILYTGFFAILSLCFFNKYVHGKGR